MTIVSVGVHSGTCASAGHHVFLYGGYDGKKYQDSLYHLDCAKLQWTKLLNTETQPDRPIPKAGCRMVFFDEKLWLFGGFDASGQTNELHVYDLSEGEEL